MALNVNNELKKNIKNTKYDDETKEFLIKALELEFQRDKIDIKHYTNMYDDIIKQYVKG